MTLVLHTDDEEPQIKEEKKKKTHTYIPRYAWYILCTYIN